MAAQTKATSLPLRIAFGFGYVFVWWSARLVGIATKPWPPPPVTQNVNFEYKQFLALWFMLYAAMRVGKPTSYRSAKIPVTSVLVVSHGSARSFFLAW